MDIDNTKPPGSYDPTEGADGQGDASFAANGKAKSSAEAAEWPTLAVLAKFNRTALDDPAKMSLLVRASVAELVDSQLNLTRPLSDPEKQSLVDFLSRDPLLRRHVESYLRKVLGRA